MSLQYKVPQNIDLEDKIVGPFTMKQFIYLMVGGGLIYGLYQAWVDYENGLTYTIIAAVPIGALALALTFVKINDRPFEYFLVNLFGYMFKPKRRIWQQGYEPSKVVFVTPQDKNPISATNAAAKHASLEEIAGHLEVQATNTGSLAPQAVNGQNPNSKMQETKTDARFTVQDLQAARQANNPAATQTAGSETAGLSNPKSETLNPKQIPNSNVQNANAAPAVQPQPAPTIAESVKGIFSRFGKKQTAAAEDTRNKIPSSAEATDGRQETNAVQPAPVQPAAEYPHF